MRDNELLAYALFDCTRQFMYILLYFTLCALAPRVRASAALVFCLGWGAYTFALGVGMVIAEGIGGFEGYPEWLVVSLMCLLTCASVIALSFQDNPDIKLFADGSAEHVPPLDSFSDIDRRCGIVAEDRGLTKRELEVMRLICKGRLSSPRTRCEPMPSSCTPSSRSIPGRSYSL